MRIFYILLFLVILISPFKHSEASHIVGGQLSYEYVSSSGDQETYKVTVQIYGDCGTAPASYASLVAGNWLTLKIDTGVGTTAINSNITVPKLQPYSGTLITPVCSDQLDSTTCTNGSIIGISMFTFQTNITLPFKSSKWRFVFLGTMSGNTAGRSSIINNVSNVGTLELYATLNNLEAPNSSSTFNSQPSPFFCLNVPTIYNVSATDPDGDQLTYSLQPALTNEVAVNYISPYSYTEPLATQSGTFVFNTSTGQMEFTPNNASIRSIVVTQVSEKRNNVVVGTSMREMFFVTLPNCNNQSSSLPVTNPENYLDVDSSGIFTICNSLQVPFSFSIPVSDPEGDNVTVTHSALPTGASLTVNNDGTPTPTVHFSWQPTNVTPGNYFFTITYTDDGCPLNTVKTVTYQIRVSGFPSNLFSFGSLEPCVATDSAGKLWVNKNINDTVAEYVWMTYAYDTLKVTTTNGSDTLFNMPSGDYKLSITTFPGCTKIVPLYIDAPNHSVSFTMDSIACAGTNLTLTNTTSTAVVDSYQQFRWSFGDGTYDYGTNTTHVYDTQGNYTVTLYGTTHLGCVDSFKNTIYIDSTQTPWFTVIKDSVCNGQSIQLKAYNWDKASNAKWNFGDNGWAYLTTNDTVIEHSYDAAGTYKINLATTFPICASKEDSTLVHILSSPKVNLGPDTSICPSSTNFINLVNYAGNQSGYVFKWNDGSTKPSLSVTQPGTYSLSVTDQLGKCYTSDEIAVRRDCYLDIPNAFTPNNDGVDDYFFPRDMLSSGVVGFKMEIYSRWGTKVFETENPQGRGWDGKFNSQDQTQGVYVYTIFAVLKDGKEINQSGNVTLLR